MGKNEILETLKALRHELETRYKVKAISLFGSFVRGEETATSDIDVLVEFGAEASYFDVVRLGDFLEEKFQRSVDVIPQGALRAELREAVLREMVAV